MTPTSPKPAIIRPQLAGSGTPPTSAVWTPSVSYSRPDAPVSVPKVIGLPSASKKVRLLKRAVSANSLSATPV